METQNFEVLGAQSVISWTGKKVTGSHHGTIGIKAGALLLDNGKLSGGSFVIDTTSIKILDITDPATNTQFAGHLFSEDFFATERFPEATFGITHVEHSHDGKELVTGNLSIKGITHPASFTADVQVADKTLSASGKILVDRTAYDMKFRSGNFFTNLGDTLIYNQFELDVTLTASAAL